MSEETLEYPPFPPLVWDLFFWVGEVALPSWAGFEVRRDRAGRRLQSMQPDGIARLSVTTLDKATRTHPIAEQVAAFRHLLNNEAAVASAVAEALAEYCPGHAYDGDDEELLGISGPDDLRPLVWLSEVHVLTVTRDGVAYIGFEFDCAWDEEHGAGVMTHLGRVVATGQAADSFQAWIAEQDTGEEQGKPNLKPRGHFLVGEFRTSVTLPSTPRF